MKLFKLVSISIFALIILGLFSPFYSIQAFGIVNEYMTGSTTNVTYPLTSNHGQYPTMWIKTRINFTPTEQGASTCVRVEATSDEGNTNYQPLISGLGSSNFSYCASPTSPNFVEGGYSFNTATPLYGQHTAKIRVSTNGGAWNYYSRTWTINNPLNVSVSATPSSINFGGSSTINWWNGTSTCFRSDSTGSPFGGINGGATGSFSVNPPGQDALPVYITCTDLYGSTTDIAVITIKPVVTITANSPITQGNPTTISWHSDSVFDTCTMTNFGTTYPAPSVTLYPSQNTTYTADCVRDNSPYLSSSNSASKTVIVNTPTPFVSLSFKPDQEKDLIKKSDTGNLGTTYLQMYVMNVPPGGCILKNITTGLSLGTFNNLNNFQFPDPPVSNLQSDSNDFKLDCTDPTVVDPPTINVKAQSGILTVPTSCTIPSGSNMCPNQPVSWTTTNPYSISAQPYTSIYQDGAKIYQISNTGNGSAILTGAGIPVGGISRTANFYSENFVDGQNTGGTASNILDTKTMIVSCEIGTTWNGSICTTPIAVPTVTTAPVTQITQTSAKGSGTIVSNGGSAVTLSGITWSTASIPTNRNPNTINPLYKTTTGWAIGGPWTPLHDMISLTPNTLYYYRAYAINDAGYAYGNQVSFTTLNTSTMFGSLTGSPNPCTIAQGSSTCNTNLTWTINNIESTLSKITANGMTDITLNTPTIGNDYGATINNITVTYPSRTFYLYNNNKSLVPVSPAGTGRIIDAQCITGTSWNGTICAPLPTSGTLTATNCSIPLGGNTCNTTLNWTTTNPIAGVNSAITSNYPFNNSQVFTGNNGTNQTATVPYSSRAFFLYHNGVQLASATPSALCTFGTAWNPTSHTCVSSVTYTVTASAGANGTISPSTRTVNAGATTTFTVTPNSGYTATIGGTCPRGGFVGTTYTTGPIASNCTVTATFSIDLATGVLTIDPLSCDIAQNASTCTVTGATWTTTNATQPSLVDVNTGIVLSTLANNSNPLTVWVAYPQTNFALRHNGFPGILDTETVTAKCVKDTEWDGSKCIATSGGLSGSITASDCTISEGESTCSSNISWNTLNPIVGHNSEVTTPVNITVGSGNDGDKTYDIGYGDTYFFLSHNSIELGQDMARAVCESGTTWNGTICTRVDIGGTDGQCGYPHDNCIVGEAFSQQESMESFTWQCKGKDGGNDSGICIEMKGVPGGINIYFNASPKRIFKGRSSTLTWKAEGATSCMGDTFDTEGKVEGILSVKPSSTTTYTITCSKEGVDSETATQEVKVSVIKFFEI